MNGKPYCKSDYDLEKRINKRSAAAATTISTKMNTTINTTTIPGKERSFSDPAPMREPTPIGCDYCGDPVREHGTCLKCASRNCSLCHRIIPPDQNPIELNADQQFHAKCFKCSHCHQVLNPKEFYVVKGEPYCLRDYSSMVVKTSPYEYSYIQPEVAPPTPVKKMSEQCADIPIGDFPTSFECSVCREMIPPKEIPFNYKGEKMHAKCFKCTRCDQVLNQKEVYEIEGKPYCLRDYSSLRASTGTLWLMMPSAKASESGQNTQYSKSEPCTPREYCEYCGDAVRESGACLKCASRTCSVCQGIIPPYENITTFHGDQMHAKCFKCSGCRQSINPKEVYEIKGKPYCLRDYSWMIANAK